MPARAIPNLSDKAALSADGRLLVPMRLQALAVDDPENFKWADLTPQYNLLDATDPASLGCWLRPNLFDTPFEPPGVGIHLHWALPTAFSHIAHEPGKRVTFRPVPNRWLVVRLWENKQQKPSVLEHRAWMIEGDYLAEDGTNAWLTVGLADDGKSRRFDAGKRLGRSLSLQDYKEEAGRSPLTAVAPGNLAFSSFYPSCRNVFGFHDKDLDLRIGGSFCYIVVGWFTDPGVDPLSGCRDMGEWLERMGRLGWSVPVGTQVLPTRVLCHGTIGGVKWPPPEADKALAFPDFQVAIGNSALDAIAAYVDHKTTSEPVRRDRLLGQLQYATLQDQPPTARELYSDVFLERARLTGLRARMHERMFTALPAGTRWEIDRPARDAEQVAQKSQPALLELPQELAEMLQNLNRDQRDCDEQRRRLVGLQRDLFAQWHKRRLLARESMAREERGSRALALDESIASLTKQIELPKQSIAQLQAGIDRTTSALRKALAKNLDEALSGHVLIDRPMPRYWRANDPVLLMAGVRIPAMQDGASPLSCRVSGQTIAGLEVADVPGYGVAYIDADDLTKNESAGKPIQDLSPEGSSTIPEDFRDLLCEVLLLDPERAALLARIAHRKQTMSVPTEQQIQPLADALRNVQKDQAGDNFFVSEKRATNGAALAAFHAGLSASITAPSAWKPVFLLWDACYRPLRSDPPKDILKHWRFDDGAVDYTRAGPTSGTDEVTYQGYAPLSDTVGRGLANGNGAFPWAAEYPEDEFVFNALTGTSLVVQSLGGLTEALIQLDATLQLPPLIEKSVVVDEQISRLVGEQYTVAPLPDVLNGEPANFFPIRGGDLDIRRVWLVDTFGRIRRVIDRIADQDDNATPPDIYISRSLAVSGSTDAIRLGLSPRLAQPSRLLFRWLSADNDTQEFLGDRATQPICGWILPNRLDDSLLISDATGKVLGAVQSVIRTGGCDNRGIRWSKYPPAALDLAFSAKDLSQTPRPGADDIPNPHLRGFVNGLLKLADDAGVCRTPAFAQLLALIARLDESDPWSPASQDLSVLVGRPLALARASLRLDLLGPPAPDQSWSSPVGSGAARVTDVGFSVGLGDRRIASDGLIGCFVSDDYGALLLSQEIEPDGRTDSYFHHRDRVPVSCDPEKPAILLSLLLDPRSGVHLSSGILPTKLVDLPPELVATVLSKLEVPFLVAPVLGERRDDGLPDMPLPTNMPGTWSWTSRPVPGADAETVPIKSESAPARSLFASMALYEGWLGLRQQERDRT